MAAPPRQPHSQPRRHRYVKAAEARSDAGRGAFAEGSVQPLGKMADRFRRRRRWTLRQQLVVATDVTGNGNQKGPPVAA